MSYSLKRLISPLLLSLALFFATYSFVYAASLQFDLIGIKDDQLKNASLRLNLLRDTYGKNLNPSNIKTLYSSAPDEIRKAIAPFGYFKPEIHSSLAYRGTNWIATFRIRPGPPMLINQVTLNIVGSGSDNTELLKFEERFPIKVGGVFHSENYTQAKDDFLQLAYNQGYIKAYFLESKILINLKSNSAGIVLLLQTGPKYYFGKFYFEPTKLADKFLQKFIPFKSSDAFSSQKLMQLQQDMGSSYYFRQVTITPDFQHIENREVPVNISTVLPPSQQYNFGLGYGTFTGPRLTAGVNFRRTTMTGQHFDAQIKLSSVLSGLAAKYYIPGRNPITDQWTIGANVQRFIPKNGRSESKQVSFGYSTKFAEIQTGLNLNYLIERYRVENLPSQNSELLYPNLTLNYTKADNLLNPTSGKSINFNLQGSSGHFYSSTSFIQAEAKAKYLFSPFDFAKVILSGDLGYTIVTDIKDLPLSMRFFAGGQNSIRGFGESSIGPGRYLGTASIEYRNRITGNWNVAIFYDAGTATDHYGGTPLSRGDGVGIVYNTIIGPVKLYLARAESKQDKPRSVEVSIGPEF